MNRLFFVLVSSVALMFAACGDSGNGASPHSNAEGSLTDSRDGQTYKTVGIGSQMWMAENLNYEMDNSYCYDDKASNCSKYGRLYTWAAAQTACPSGWHLPSMDEIVTLFNAVGDLSIAGKMLKSTSGWKNNGNGTDEFSFSALSAGAKYFLGDYDYEGHSAFFWSSTKDDDIGGVYIMHLKYDDDDAYLDFDNKNDWFSVRCVKDE